jgi:hypothetical protein
MGEHVLKLYARQQQDSRCFDEHWPERVDRMVMAAEAALDR